MVAIIIDGSNRTEVDSTEHSAGVTGNELSGAHKKSMAVSVSDFAVATGWALKPEGFCRGEVCVPVRDRSFQGADGRIDVALSAVALGRPVVVDAARGIAAIGEPAHRIAEQMITLRAPEFTLPDLDGNPVSLRDFNRRKVLLLAWSSW